ncbi:MAG: RidA family protein [Pseudomonadota bacterium]
MTEETVAQRLERLGVSLPEASAPGANYVPWVREGSLLFVTGQLCQWNGERLYIGQVGAAYDLETAQKAARVAALNVLAHVGAAAGLGAVRRVVRLGIYVNSASGFHGQSQVANGASDLMMEVFGEAGRHTRLAIGVMALPYNVAVEVEGVFALA